MKNVTELNPPAIPMFDKRKYKLIPDISKDTSLLHKEPEVLPGIFL
jgi:hypothetical protein